jgi:three-Cys-motif partner protein
MYIDPFAGSGGYLPTCSRTEGLGQGFFPQPAMREHHGSVRIALEVKPGFGRYILIDKNPKNVAKLRQLREERPNIRKDIRIKEADANTYLRKLCKETDWTCWRAVMFLDPYGMQVEWTTIKAVAQTRAIDLWYLFPLGVAVNRLLRLDGQIRTAECHRLDQMFGSHDWYGAFYRRVTDQNLLGEYTKIVKLGRLKKIGEYYLDLLKSVFPGVARRPFRLYKGSIPLYWLCFATGDEDDAHRRVATAEKILVSPRIHWGA